MASFSINNPIGSIVDAAKDVFDRLIPDKAAAAQAKAALDQLKESDEAKALADEVQVQLAAMANIQAEAKGSSWLQRNWRPMMALWFGGLVGAFWFGFTPPNLSQDSVDHLFSLVQMMIGGYTIGRTVEKVAPHVVQAVKSAKS